MGAFILALNHPLWPMAALIALWCVMVLEAYRPGSWLFLVPACIPVLNFSPWTGWIVFEELDILLLGLIAGGYARWVFVPRLGYETGRSGKWPSGGNWEKCFDILWGGLAAVMLLALVRGVIDAEKWAFDWFAGYDHALNSWRLFKSFAYATLFLPLLRNLLQDGDSQDLFQRQFARGMVAGLAVVCAAVVWERAGFVGLWNFSSNYRTVALFWEMHVGGAAIDAYLAVAAPFALWALLNAKRPVPWLAAACLVLVVGYACLTTFSRGVYLAVVAPQLMLAILLYRRQAIRKQKRVRWRWLGGLLVLVLLGAEVVAVLGGGTFMSARIAKSNQDFGSRMAHWQRGLELLQSPAEAGAGIGLGRFPARYSAHAEVENFPGTVEIVSEPGPGGATNPFVRLTTPANGNDLPGIYALTQRVDGLGSGAQVLRFDVRTQQPVEVLVQVCERHLLYDRACIGKLVRVKPADGAWQTQEVLLMGPPINGTYRLLTFDFSLQSAGASVDVDSLRLGDPRGENLLSNGEFSRNMAQWLPSAQSYFVPWHVDNLFLEWLIERGGVGLLLFCVVVGAFFLQVLLVPSHGGLLSPYLAAGVAGTLVVGLVSSVMDVPRVALLLYLLFLVYQSSVFKR